MSAIPLTTLTNCSNDVNATVVSYALRLLILLQTACLVCEGTIHTNAYRLWVLTWIGNCLVFHVHLLSPAPKCARTLSTVLNGAYTERNLAIKLIISRESNPTTMSCLQYCHLHDSPANHLVASSYRVMGQENKT